MDELNWMKNVIYFDRNAEMYNGMRRNFKPNNSDLSHTNLIFNRIASIEITANESGL